MLGDTTYEFESSDLSDKAVGALSESDIERLLTAELTTVDVRQGDRRVFPPVEGRQCEVTRPRARVMHPSADPADRYLELRFGVNLVIQSDQLDVREETEESPLTPTPRGQQTGSDKPADGDRVDAAASVDDALPDPADTAADAVADDDDDDDEVETKHVLDADGSITEVPVDADEEHPANHPDDTDNQ